MGTIYDSKLLFNTHCDYILSKTSQKLVFLKTICPRVDAKTLLNLYKTSILAIPMFHSQQNSNYQNRKSTEKSN